MPGCSLKQSRTGHLSAHHPDAHYLSSPVVASWHGILVGCSCGVHKLRLHLLRMWHLHAFRGWQLVFRPSLGNGAALYWLAESFRSKLSKVQYDSAAHICARVLVKWCRAESVITAAVTCYTVPCVDCKNTNAVV